MLFGSAERGSAPPETGTGSGFSAKEGTALELWGWLAGWAWVSNATALEPETTNNKTKNTAEILFILNIFPPLINKMIKKGILKVSIIKKFKKLKKCFMIPECTALAVLLKI